MSFTVSESGDRHLPQLSEHLFEHLLIAHQVLLPSQELQERLILREASRYEETPNNERVFERHERFGERRGRGQLLSVGRGGLKVAGGCSLLSLVLVENKRVRTIGLESGVVEEEREIGKGEGLVADRAGRCGLVLAAASSEGEEDMSVLHQMRRDLQLDQFAPSYS